MSSFASQSWRERPGRFRTPPAAPDQRVLGTPDRASRRSRVWDPPPVHNLSGRSLLLRCRVSSHDGPRSLRAPPSGLDRRADEAELMREERNLVGGLLYPAGVASADTEPTGGDSQVTVEDAGGRIDLVPPGGQPELLLTFNLKVGGL